jgi:hypothetical protein
VPMPIRLVEAVFDFEVSMSKNTAGGYRIGSTKGRSTPERYFLSEAEIVPKAEPADERIADERGDELEHGDPDFPGQFPDDREDVLRTLDGAWDALRLDLAGVAGLVEQDQALNRNRTLIEAVWLEERDRWLDAALAPVEAMDEVVTQAELDKVGARATASMEARRWSTKLSDSRPEDREGVLRAALSANGWFVATVVGAEWVESSLWGPVFRSALAQPRSRVEDREGDVIPYTGPDAPFVGDHPGCTYDAPHKHAQPRSRVEGLDVERLARALDILFEQKWGAVPTAGQTTVNGGYAHDIAREYAALAPVEPEGKR